MEETLRNHLLALGHRFNEATKVSLSTIGKRALNDNTVFSRLEAAEIGFGVRTYDRLAQYFSDHWPADTEWPADVPRPAPVRQPEAAE